MNISLPPDLQQFVEHKVRSGRYPNASAVVERALRLLRMTPQSHDELKEMLDEAIAQLDRGEGIVLEGDDQLRAFFDDIKARGRQRLAGR